jgi:hypothetical protein
MEQAINSDLPGELKALVNENVYDTATGRYLLVPVPGELLISGDFCISRSCHHAPPCVIWLPFSST